LKEGRRQEAFKVIDVIRVSPSITPLPSYACYPHPACALASLERFDEALGALAEGMQRTKAEEGRVPCFVGNCWRMPYLEPLRNPPYRERLEKIIGPKQRTSRESAARRRCDHVD